MTPEASPFWQNAFLVAVLVLIGLCMGSGWRAGVLRMTMQLIGLIAGGIVGVALSGMLAPLVSAFLPIPASLLGVVLTLLIAILFYIACWLFAALLLKRTAQQPGGLLRLMVGAGGAAVGAIVGLTFFWAALLAVRGVGGVLEGGFVIPGAKYPGAIAASFVKLKRSIEAGPTGNRITSFDIVPEKVYAGFESYGRFLAALKVDRTVADRFFQYPQIVEFMTEPAVLNLTNDPKVQAGLADGDILPLFTSPEFAKALEDPRVVEKLKQIDIVKAFDFATTKQGTTAPAPAP